VFMLLNISDVITYKKNVSYVVKGREKGYAILNKRL
jgi:hypothetical protein